MTSEHRGLAAAWYRGAAWLWLLRPLELLFRVVAALRRGLYRRGLLRVYRAAKPVVVVGNITVGGTGKTPVVIALIESLAGQGIRAGVVSRGYGASGKQFPHVVTATSTAADCGDEPLLIFRRTGCPVVVAPVRAEAVSTLLADFTVDVVVSDDGLQHYALYRDMEIAVLDASSGIGNGFCLPAGPLREPPGRLRSVDYLLYRGSDDPATGVTYQQECLVNTTTGERRPAEPRAPGEPVYALAGIGQPKQFLAALQELGFTVEARLFADHHAYTADDFSGLSDKPIIMTEKDAVKCAEIAGADAWYLRISARLPPGVTGAVAALARS